MNLIPALPLAISSANQPAATLLHSARQRLCRLASKCTSQLAALLVTVSIYTHAAGTTIACWGSNNFGECNIPVGLSGATQIAGGNGQFIVLNRTGMVTCWGDNTYGKATPPIGLSGVASIAAGENHSIAVKANTTVVCWGNNQYGQSLGIDASANPITTTPGGQTVKILGITLTGVAQAAGGPVHTVGLRSNGTVICWGQSYQCNPPAGLSSVIHVAAGGSASLAAKSDGIVVGWGFGGSGQLSIPTGLANVIQVALSNRHAMALKRDGTVVCWGDNYDHECDVPAGLGKVVQIAAGLENSLAVTADGHAAVWGWNGRGQCDVPVWLVGVTQIAGSGYAAGALVNYCPWDLDGSEAMDFGDLALMLLDFGPCVGCRGDFDGNGQIDFGDTALLLLEFGPCP